MGRRPVVQSWVERENVREEGRTEALAGVMAVLVFGEWYVLTGTWKGLALSLERAQ